MQNKKSRNGGITNSAPQENSIEHFLEVADLFVA
jgi:hypothetical protein